MTKRPLTHQLINIGYNVADPFRRAIRRIYYPLSLGVRGIVIDDQARVLLVHHSYMPGWFFPGGGVKRRELVQGGLERELHEEVGVTLKEAPRLLGLYSNFVGYRSDHVAVFVVEKFEMVPNLNHEISEWKFFSLDALPGEITPGTKRRLTEYLGEAPPSHEW